VDHYKLILVGGNTAFDLGYAGSSTQDLNPNRDEDLKDILNALLQDRGMKVVDKDKSPRISFARSSFPKVKRTEPMPSEVISEDIWNKEVKIDTTSLWYKEMEKFVEKGERIRAIKHLRTNSGMGLKESKDFLDKWYPCDEPGMDGVVTVS
jgi:hypothetical protein